MGFAMLVIKLVKAVMDHWPQIVSLVRILTFCLMDSAINVIPAAPLVPQVIYPYLIIK
jgi:hypothetical protein